MQGGERRFAQVIIPSPLKEPLTYAVPPLLQDGVEVGVRVLVPLGQRKVAGVVCGLLASPVAPLKTIKEIAEVLDDRPVLDAALLRLIDWVARYYAAARGEVLAAALPPSLRARSSRVIAAVAGEFPGPGALEKRILDLARGRKGRLTVPSLRRNIPEPGLQRALERLRAIGAVELRERMSARRSMGGAPKNPGVLRSDRDKSRPVDGRPLELTPEQRQAVERIGSRLTRGGFETFLLYGVTGSGKTEIYLRAAELARATNKRSLILIPEISLTPQLLDRLGERFPGRVGVLHSALSAAERRAQWWHILNRSVDVVIGARSAVFAPLPDLGLIVVDEEHDPSYKQDEGMRYHARDLAVLRGKILGCPVILGSATPAVESFENCRQGRYRLLELTHRVERKPFPRVDTVDLRPQAREKKSADEAGDRASRPAILSPRLEAALKENFARGQQSLVFLNRRGFANFLQCRLCGHVRRCPHCSVSLTLHLKDRSLCCHHCGYREPVREQCPGCGNPSLAGLGFGTETVEREISSLLPEARIARMDRDTMAKRGSTERLLRGWEMGQIDVLVGTQMITKGHDVAGVTLVGVILADLSLNLPDFRAAEKTFQLLAQVAGRAGRGGQPGCVIIQTYAPDHYAVRHVISHDYRSFFAEEIEFRRALRYPPFCRLLQLRLEGPAATDVAAKARLIGEELRQRQRGDSRLATVEILGPAPAPIEKLRNRYRWQTLIKGDKRAPLLELAARAREILPRSRKTRLFVDVDPYNML